MYALNPIASLRNLGPSSAEALSSVGIRSIEELQAVGTLAACERLIRKGTPISLNMAYAIEGALIDCDWRELSSPVKGELKMEFKRRLADFKEHG